MMYEPPKKQLSVMAKHSLRGRKTRSSRLPRITLRIQKNLKMKNMIINMLNKSNCNPTKITNHPTPLHSHQLKTLNVILNHKTMTNLLMSNMVIERGVDHHLVLSKQ